MIKKLKTIIFSRFKKTKAESFIEKRRAICKTCPLNTKNLEKISFEMRVIKFLSDSFSWLTGNREQDDLGACSVCGCSIFYKTQEKTESCAAKPQKWRKIYNRKK